MKNCEFEAIGQRDDGRYAFRCTVCKQEVSGKQADPAKAHRNCARKRSPAVPMEIRQKIEVHAARVKQPKLVGDLLSELTTKLGFPPCGGCQKRKEWLNAAHRWVLEQVTQLRQDS